MRNFHVLVQMTLVLSSAIALADVPPAPQPMHDHPRMDAFKQDCFKFVKTTCLGKDWASGSMQDCLKDSSAQAGDSGIACSKDLASGPHFKPSKEMQEKFAKDGEQAKASCPSESGIMHLRSVLDLVDSASFASPTCQASLLEFRDETKNPLYQTLVAIGKTCRSDIDQKCLFSGVVGAKPDGKLFSACLDSNKKTFTQACQDALPLLQKSLKLDADGNLDHKQGQDVQAKVTKIDADCQHELQTFRPEEFFGLMSNKEKTSKACQDTLQSIQADMIHHMHHQDHGAPFPPTAVQGNGQAQ